MITDDEVNSSTSVLYNIDLDKLVEFSNIYANTKLKTKFKNTVMGLCHGRVSVKEWSDFLLDNPELIVLKKTLPDDPHLMTEFIRLAEKVAKK